MYGLRGYGLGMDYYGLLAQANLQDCDPMDTACVSNNVARQAAVEDYWAAHQGDPGGVPDNTRLTFQDQTPGQISEFHANPVQGNIVDDRGILQVNASPQVVSQRYPVYVPPAAPLPPTPPPTPPPATPPTPPPASPPQGSPVLSPTLTLPKLPTVGGFDLSSVPWWGWVAGVGVAFLAFRGNR